LVSKSSPNRIVSKIEKHIRFDLHTIRFNLSQNIRFDNQIRFDFDLIWQPWCSQWKTVRPVQYSSL
jgi:hypothetical protein